MTKRKIYIIPFAHLDLFWAGSREECLSRGAKIISTALDLLERHADYRFLVEASNFMEMFLDSYPGQKERVKKYIHEQRLEVIPMRAITYSHLPSGEVAVRNLLYSLDFYQNELDFEPELMSLSDIPGATAQLPQIAKLAGLKGIILSRGFEDHTDHVRWTAPDGSVIRAYTPVHYANLSMSMSREKYETMKSETKWITDYYDKVDYDQIVHWGTDLFVLTEKTYQNICKLNKEFDHEFTFCTFHEFLEKTKDAPCKELKGELPSFWTHIESSWPDIWPLDIPAEAAMRQAEFLASLSWMADGRRDYPGKEMRQAWLDLLDSMDHNQNGIGGEIADKDKLELKLHSQKTAELLSLKMCRRLAAHTKIPHENAHPIVLINPCSWTRSGVVKARTTCYGPTFATSFAEFTPEVSYSSPYYKVCGDENKKNFRLIDQDGNEVPYKKETHLMMLSDSMEISFYAKDIPAFGSKVFYLEPLEKESGFKSPFVIHDDAEEDKKFAGRYAGTDTVENQFYRLEIPRVTGEFTLIDKRSGKTVLSSARLEGREEKRGEYIFLMDLTGRTFPSVIDSVKISENNSVYCIVEINGSVCGEAFTQKITLYAEDPVVDVENIIHWKGPRYVRIEQVFPFASEEKTLIRYGTPFGMVQYPYTMYQTDGKFNDKKNQNDPTWQMRLVRDWTDISDSVHGMTIASDHRMWDFSDGLLRNCMIRGIGWTSGGVKLNDDFTETAVQRPPDGTYSFKFRISARDGNGQPDWRMGSAFNLPIISAVCENGDISDKSGLELPSLPETKDSTVQISWVKPAEDGNGIILRCYECMGQSGSIDLPEIAGKWIETDLRERKLHEVNGSVQFRPWEIKTLRLQK